MCILALHHHNDINSVLALHHECNQLQIAHWAGLGAGQIAKVGGMTVTRYDWCNQLGKVRSRPMARVGTRQRLS